MNKHQQHAAHKAAAELIEETAAAVLAHPNALHTVSILISALAEAEQVQSLAAALHYTTPNGDDVAATISALLN